MLANKSSGKLLIGVLLVIFVGIALYLRIYFPWDQVFSKGWIKFTGIDAYYQMRLVDNMVHNFPHLTMFDPYSLYPNDSGVGGVHFFNWLLSSIIWAIGLGSPSDHTIDIIGVYFPVVLGVLTIIPVYFIGKALFNRWAGVLSAALISIMPGEFLGRSILGFTDQHVAETLFTTTVVLFLIMALKEARQRQLTFGDLKRRDWAKAARPLIYSLLCGIFLVIYLFTWIGALLFIFIIALYLAVQFVVDHLRRKSSDYLAIVGIIVMLIAAVIFIPYSPSGLYTLAMFGALILPIVLAAISWLMKAKGLRPAYYPLTLLALLGAGLGAFYLVNPQFFQLTMGQLSILSPAGNPLTTTLEMQPLFFPGTQFSNAVAWGNFTAGIYISMVILAAVLIYLLYSMILKIMGKMDFAGKNLAGFFTAEKIFMLVWCLLILLATLGQRRFAYYFAVNVALLTGYFSWLFIRLIASLADYVSERANAAELKEQMMKAMGIARAQAGKEPKPGKEHKEEFYGTKYLFAVMAAVIVLALVFVPDVPQAITVGKQARFAPTDAWQSSLVWMKENTPEPFNNPDVYYGLDKPPAQQHYIRFTPETSVDELLQAIQPKKEGYNYPESFYGVTAWWDYGYWITRIAHRVPNVNPGQDPVLITLVANAFLANDEDSAIKILRELDSDYLLLDNDTTISKFWAITQWANRQQTEFVDTYVVINQGQLVPIRLYYPEYYRTFCVRLYNFDGQAVIPENTYVATYDVVNAGGMAVKQITDIKTFDTYKEAADYIASQDSPNLRIIGNSPFVSPVPLEALKDYKLVHSSAAGTVQHDVGVVPDVKIFEYSGER